jgi:hypothetical protein
VGSPSVKHDSVEWNAYCTCVPEKMLGSSRCPATAHLRPAVSAVVLGKLHLLAHAIGVPVNPERCVADAAREAVLIPSGLGAVVPACDEHQRGTSRGDRGVMPIGTSRLGQFRIGGRRNRRSDCPCFLSGRQVKKLCHVDFPLRSSSPHPACVGCDHRGALRSVGVARAKRTRS